MYKLRGHHLFCLLGYRGMGYSKEYVENMTRIHQILKNNPKTLVQLVKGPDQLCEKYPNSSEYHCQDQNIYNRDDVILEKMGSKIGQILKWENIESCVENMLSQQIFKLFAKHVLGVPLGFVSKELKGFMRGRDCGEVE